MSYNEIENINRYLLDLFVCKYYLLNSYHLNDVIFLSRHILKLTFLCNILGQCTRYHV